MVPTYLLSLRNGLEMALIMEIVFGAWTRILRNDLSPAAWFSILSAVDTLTWMMKKELFPKGELAVSVNKTVACACWSITSIITRFIFGLHCDCNCTLPDLFYA